LEATIEPPQANGVKGSDTEAGPPDNPHHIDIGSPLPNGPRLSCGALKKNSFFDLRAPSASSAC
jgi:hypothetical protein